MVGLKKDIATLIQDERPGDRSFFSFILVILIYSSCLKLFIVKFTKQKSSDHFATCQVGSFRV